MESHGPIAVYPTLIWTMFYEPVSVLPNDFTELCRILENTISYQSAIAAIGGLQSKNMGNRFGPFPNPPTPCMLPSDGKIYIVVQEMGVYGSRALFRPVMKIIAQKQCFSPMHLINPLEFDGFTWISESQKELLPGAYIAVSKKERFGPFKTIPDPSHLKPLMSYVIFQEMTKPDGTLRYRRITQMDL